MSIYSKLAEARVRLQKKDLKKSGVNHFISVKVKIGEKNGRAVYEDKPMPYFELSDFLPSINEIFKELGLCSIVSFTEQLATLTIFDSESDGKVEFTSPMPAVPTQNAKGNIAPNTLMQSIGALETYQRRYLYVAALEIVESDAIDSQDFSNNKTAFETPKTKSQEPSQKSIQQNVNSIHREQYHKDVENLRKRLLNKTKEQIEEEKLYDKSINWLKENNLHDLIDEYNLMYNDFLLNLI